MQEQIRRQRLVILVLVVIVVFAGFAAPLAVIVTQQRTANEVQLQATQEHAKSQLAVTCAIIRSQTAILIALEQVRKELGLPHRLIIPEVPVECDGA